MTMPFLKKKTKKDEDKKTKAKVSKTEEIKFCDYDRDK